MFTSYFNKPTWILRQEKLREGILGPFQSERVQNFVANRLQNGIFLHLLLFFFFPLQEWSISFPMKFEEALSSWTRNQEEAIAGNQSNFLSE